MLEKIEKQLRISSMRDRVSPQEWQARVDLAAGYRLVDLFGMADMGANHISLRVPGEENAFLINPYGLMYDEITASSLIKIDTEGNILEKPDYGDFDYGINRAGFVIHGAIHAAREDAHCVLHTHTWPGMAVSSLKEGLLPMTQTAMRFAKVAYHDYNGVVLNLGEQERLVRDLGEHTSMILRNHGLLTCGSTVGEAFNTMHRLELCCKAQVAALSCGREINPVPQEVVEATYVNYLPGTRRRFGVQEWPGMLRKLDKVDPSYRT